MKQFDLEKVEQILKEENAKHKICEAKLYLYGDESWNTTTIIENNKFLKDKWFICYGGSFWATPMLQVSFVIDDEIFNKEFGVYKNVDDENFDGGCVEEWLSKTNVYKELGLELHEDKGE
jgi:hypothetical protein